MIAKGTLVLSVSLTLALALGCRRQHSIYLDLSSIGGSDGGTGLCPDPLLAYDPDSYPDGPLLPQEDAIAGITAGVMLPFDAATTCSTVVVGIVVGVGVCELPAAIEIAAFDSPTPLPTTVPALYDVIPLDEGMLTETTGGSVYEMRLPITTVHAAGLYPVVGARVRSNLCPVLMPYCDDMRVLEYAQGTWTNDVPGQLYYGLADCAVTGP